MNAKRGFSGAALLAAACSTFLLFATLASGQNVSISPAEFQRLVYSGHLLAQMHAKPELDAALVTLLEMQPRNPGANPEALAAMLRDALLRYRTNAPICLRLAAWSDEVLVAYLESVHQVPAHTNFNPAVLNLLFALINHPNTPNTPDMDQAARLHGGNQRLLTAEDTGARRQNLVETCTRRAQVNLAFRIALNGLIVPEANSTCTDTPAQILQKDTVLAQNPAFQELLRLSSLSPDGSLNISSNSLRQLFAQETASLRDMINSNRALHLAISAKQADHLAYLTNQPLIQADIAWEAAVKADQARQLAAATASMPVLGSLISKHNSRLAGDLMTAGKCWLDIAKGISAWGQGGGLKRLGACYNIVGAGLAIFSLFSGDGGPDAAVMQELSEIKNMINGLRDEMHGRFNRVDRALNLIYEGLSSRLDEINLVLGQVDRNTQQIRKELLDLQSDLHRLERELYEYLDAGMRLNFKTTVNWAIGYESLWNGPMSYASYIGDGPENTFYTWAYSHAPDQFCSPVPTPADLQDSALYSQLHVRHLESNLSYLHEFLRQRLGLPILASVPLANPRDWFLGCDAYVKLALENPSHFRRVNVTHLTNLITIGENVESFLRKLTLINGPTGAQLNQPLYDQLLAYYQQKLAAFQTQIEFSETEFGLSHPNVLRWHNWDTRTPRFATPGPQVVGVNIRFKPALPPIRKLSVAGTAHLAITTNNQPLAWPVNDLPPGLTNVVDVLTVGGWSMAIDNQGQLWAWGDNTLGQCDIPQGLGRVKGLAAGGVYYEGGGETAVSLALKEDGTVVCWGTRTNVPSDVTNISAIAASGEHCLALRSNTTVTAWGTNDYGQCNVPVGLTNVIAIAAGIRHSVALKTDGTVNAWGDTNSLQCNVPVGLNGVQALAASGDVTMALRSNGTLVVWGSDSPVTTLPPGLTNVTAIAFDWGNGYAVKSDGSFVVWGDNYHGECISTNEVLDTVALSGGDFHHLLLTSRGRVFAWGNNFYGQSAVPPGLSNVIAIAAAGWHSLALKVDGTVTAWGDNDYGQCNVPADLSNVVAIAAGTRHNLALKSDGTVRAWGYSAFGECNVPGDLHDVVAIAAGRNISAALLRNGTVRLWQWQSWYPVGTLTNIVAISRGESAYDGSIYALRQDGTVLKWESNAGGTAVVPGVSNVIALLPVGRFLLADGTVFGEPGTSNIVMADNTLSNPAYLQAPPASNPDDPSVRWIAPGAVPELALPDLIVLREHVLTNLNTSGSLHSAAGELSGARSLLESILALALPYTLERDDVLHGFLYGSESLIERDLAVELYSQDIQRLLANPQAPPIMPSLVASPRLQRFRERLQIRLNEVAANGQPEIARVVGHTLCMLRLLRDAWSTTPRPSLEIISQANGVECLLYGEPHAHHTLMESTDLSNWSMSTVYTNWHNHETILRPLQINSRRFHRAYLPQAP